jgi:hypothetical protein
MRSSFANSSRPDARHEESAPPFASLGARRRPRRPVVRRRQPGPRQANLRRVGKRRIDGLRRRRNCRSGSWRRHTR